MPAVTIPGVGRVNFPDSMPVPEIQAAAVKLASRVGIDPNTGKRDEGLAILDELQTASPQGRLEPSLADRIAITDWTPLTLGTMGALATGGTSLVPSVIGAGIGGGAGGGLVESRDPNATRGSIAGAALRSGATMATSELAGFGLGALANRMIAPNLARYVDPMKPVRERVSAMGIPQYLRGAASRATTSLPPRLQRVAKIAATPIGGELLEAAAVPAITAAFGPFAGAAAYLGRAAFAPGILQRYLSRSQLPSALTRTLGRQATTTAIRYPLLEDQSGR